MSQNKETQTLVLALLVTLGILWAGVLLFGDIFFGYNNQRNRENIARNITETRESTTPSNTPISFGENSLLPGDILPAKAEGIRAINKNNFAEAVTQLTKALQSRKNDPESLIYLNNARIGSNQSYKIAAFVSLGDSVNVGLEILRGVAQAQEEINQAGGIRGIKLKVGIVDDSNNPNTAQQIATNLVKNQDLLGVVGPYTSDNTLAAGEVFNTGELVAISPTATSVKISNFSPYVFRSVPSDFMAARSLANHMNQRLQKQKAVVFFNSRSEYSKSLKSEFVSSLSLEGGQTVREIDVSQADFSAARSLQQAQTDGAEAIMLATDSSSLDKVLQVVQLNQKQLPILAGDGNYSLKTLEIGRENAVGMMIAIPWHIEGNPSATFPQKSRQLWGADVSWRTASAYDATIALAKAIEANPSRAGIQKSLISGDFSAPGADQTIRFLNSGDRNANIQLVEVQAKTPSSSGTGFDFVPLLKK